MTLKCIKRNGFVEQPLELFSPTPSSRFQQNDGQLLLRLSGFARLTDFGCLGMNKPPRLRSSFLGLCTFVPLLSSLSTGSSTKNSRQELLARTPLHRLIITKGLRMCDTYSRISLSVMIAPGEPSISLRSCLANNSKGRF